MPNFQPASTFAQQFGVKSVIFGGPGIGKTPLVLTAPNPVIMATEAGFMTLKGSNIPTVLCQTVDEIEEFMRWFTESKERNQYHTLFLDSGSQMAEISVTHETNKKSKSGNKVDGKAAYGEMSTFVMKHMNTFFYTRNIHVVIIAKQGKIDVGNGEEARPYFPGKDLNIKIPHLFDEVLHYAKTTVPGVGEVKALRTRETYGIFSRDRSGKLAEFEQPDLSNLFNKIMQG